VEVDVGICALPRGFSLKKFRSEGTLDRATRAILSKLETKHKILSTEDGI